MSGGLAQVSQKHLFQSLLVLANLQVFGRRPIMLGSLLIFAVGSAASGAAPNLNALIAGRGGLYIAF